MIGTFNKNDLKCYRYKIFFIDSIWNDLTHESIIDVVFENDRDTYIVED